MHEEQLTEQFVDDLKEGQLLLIGGSWWVVGRVDRMNLGFSISIKMHPATFGEMEDDDPKSNPNPFPCVVTFIKGTKVPAS